MKVFDYQDLKQAEAEIEWAQEGLAMLVELAETKVSDPS